MKRHRYHDLTTEEQVRFKLLDEDAFHVSFATILTAPIVIFFYIGIGIIILRYGYEAPIAIEPMKRLGYIFLAIMKSYITAALIWAVIFMGARFYRRRRLIEKIVKERRRKRR